MVSDVVKTVEIFLGADCLNFIGMSNWLIILGI